MLRSARGVIVGAVLVVANVAMTPAAVAESQAVAVGARFHDGLDSRASVTAFGTALARLGYATSGYSNGRMASDSWSDGLNSAVFGVFGHGNAGLMQTAEGPVDADDQFLAAGDIGYLSGGNFWYWSDYLPYLDVDDLRLAVFAGCYTGNVDPDLSSFGRVGEARGVDAVIGFEGLVYYPADCTSCSYAGNYFWERFSEYVGNGESIGPALSKARSDLVAKEGSSHGWDAWKIDGAAANPAAVTLSPAGAGEYWNSRPFGINPFDITSLTTVSHHVVTVDEQRYEEVGTQEGVLYRLADDGSLAWLHAPTSRTGAVDVQSADAREAALTFAERYVPWFDASAGVVHLAPRSHADGESLLAVSWRLPDGGPALVEAEVDLRTGAITDFVASRGASSPSAGSVSAAAAEVIARETVPGAVLVDVQQETWSGPVWRVILERPEERLTPDLVQVIVDARTGDVVQRLTT